jgi:hypothetical protein
MRIIAYLLIFLMFFTTNIIGGPVALGMCCTSACLLSGPYFLACVTLCVETAGAISPVPGVCVGAHLAPA